jgi:hypothetical protein
MSFKPEFQVVNDKKFYTNGQNFATREEAEESARSRFFRWTAATAWMVNEYPDEEFPVNYRWDEEKGDVPLDR